MVIASRSARTWSARDAVRMNDSRDDVLSASYFAAWRTRMRLCLGFGVALCGIAQMSPLSPPASRDN